MDGIILITSKVNTSYLKILEDRNIPAVLIDNDLPDCKFDIVKIDNFHGGKMATEYLITLGHIDIACITGPYKENISYRRVEGFKQALRENNLSINDEFIIAGKFDVSSGAQCANILFNMDKIPTAIFACNDQMAVGVIQSAAAHDLNVPDDISVIGFDDINLARYTVPPLTTIGQPLREIGKQAINCILEKIQNPKKNPRVITLNLRLEVRGSTKKNDQEILI